MPDSAGSFVGYHTGSDRHTRRTDFAEEFAVGRVGNSAKHLVADTACLLGYLFIDKVKLLLGVLNAMNVEKVYARGTIRVSLSANNTEAEINQISQCIIKILKP